MLNWRHGVRILIAIAALAVGASVGRAQSRPGQPALASLDSLLAAYASGDHDVVRRMLTRSQDFRGLQIMNRRRFDGWLRRWQPARAALLIEMARTASAVAPAYTPPLLAAGQQYVTRHTRIAAASPADREIARLWHRIALGILQRRRLSDEIEHYVGAVRVPAPAPGSAADDPRLLFAHAVAQEQRCQANRPTLVRSGTPVDTLARAAASPTGRGRPRPVMSDTEERLACLAEAAARFEAAAAADEVRAEARLRAGWALFQIGRFQEALTSIANVGSAGEDVELQYWIALFRGRVATALGRPSDAEAAYRDALAVFPRAQSAGIGLALTLVDLDRAEDADAAARAIRGESGRAIDPWWTYAGADERFIDPWIARLREAIR